jgi:hypothetical protein
MIYVATVHWRSDRWIDLQIDHLRRNLFSPFRIYADLEQVTSPRTARFDVTTDLAARSPNGWTRHAQKLNALAELIAEDADARDTLIFLDGDAFPVAPLDALLEERLGEAPLIAIRRDENLGDVQPHPSFCATTVGFWRDLGGVHDVGGKLLYQLHAHGAEWSPLLRSSSGAFHPVFFAVYDDTIYHHGAGFRRPISRYDLRAIGGDQKVPAALVAKPTGPLVLRLAWKLRAWSWYVAKKRPQLRRENRLISRNRELSEWVFDRLQRDRDFWRTL